jgi:hypothetical protein
MNQCKDYIDKKGYPSENTEPEDDNFLAALPWPAIKQQYSFIKHIAEKARKADYPTIEEITKFTNLLCLGEHIAVIKEKQKNPSFEYAPARMTFKPFAGNELVRMCFGSISEDLSDFRIVMTPFSILFAIETSQHNANNPEQIIRNSRFTSNHLTSPELAMLQASAEETLHSIQYKRDPKKFIAEFNQAAQYSPRQRYLKLPIEIEAGELCAEIIRDFGENHFSNRLFVKNAILNALAR